MYEIKKLTGVYRKEGVANRCAINILLGEKKEVKFDAERYVDVLRLVSQLCQRPHRGLDCMLAVSKCTSFSLYFCCIQLTSGIQSRPFIDGTTKTTISAKVRSLDVTSPSLTRGVSTDTCSL